MNFTCHGTVTHWRAAAEISTTGNRNTNATLGIWRERSSQPGTYDRVASIELGTCGSGVEATAVAGMTGVYECTLPESLRVAVQPGDIVGIDLPGSNEYKFRIYFDRDGEPTNYEYSGNISTATISEGLSVIQEQPQLSLTVETVAATTTQSPPATTLSTTTDRSTTQDPTTTLFTARTEGTTTAHTEERTQDSTTMEAVTSSAAQPEERLNIGLIVGAVVGSVLVLTVLSIIITLTLALVYAARKYKTVPRNGGGRTRRSRNGDLSMEMKVNKSYIAVNRGISIEENVAYGQCSSYNDYVYDIIADDTASNVTHPSTTNHTYADVHGVNEAVYDYIQ